MMKKFLLALIFLLNCSTCAADELDAAEIRLICAVCSVGAYSDDNSFFTRSMLTTRGWQIEKLASKNNRVETKAYLVSKGDIKILTIAGTENLKDVEVDFRVGRVHLDGTPLDKEKVSKDEIFVHKGFRDYADAVLSDGLAEQLITSLKKNPRETLYITGHSLGGAVATLAAIRLADSGVPTERLKIITFGAPAIGSKAFAASYENKIDLTRVVMKGDIIKKSLSKLGYVQFGKVLECEPSHTSNHFEHKMAVYLDCAIRDYYAAGGTLNYEARDKINAPIYVAPILLLKDSFHKSDEELILNALDDSLQNHFGKLTFATAQSIELDEENLFDDDAEEFVAAAREHDCKYVLIRILSAKKIRDAPSGDRHVTLEEIILDADGALLSMQTSGASTDNLTIFEAAIFAQENLIEDTKNLFK